MAKRAIDAKQAVADIRSGRDDDALIAKYELSAEMLQSLFDKLLSAGLITQADLKRRHLLNDHAGNLRGRDA